LEHLFSMYARMLEARERNVPLFAVVD
jgi:hypothetical protein